MTDVSGPPHAGASPVRDEVTESVPLRESGDDSRPYCRPRIKPALAATPVDGVQFCPRHRVDDNALAHVGPRRTDTDHEPTQPIRPPPPVHSTPAALRPRPFRGHPTRGPRALALLRSLPDGAGDSQAIRRPDQGAAAPIGDPTDAPIPGGGRLFVHRLLRMFWGPCRSARPGTHYVTKRQTTQRCNDTGGVCDVYPHPRAHDPHVSTVHRDSRQSRRPHQKLLAGGSWCGADRGRHRGPRPVLQGAVQPHRPHWDGRRPETPRGSCPGRHAPRGRRPAPPTPRPRPTRLRPARRPPGTRRPGHRCRTPRGSMQPPRPENSRTAPAGQRRLVFVNRRHVT